MGVFFILNFNKFSQGAYEILSETNLVALSSVYTCDVGLAKFAWKRGNSVYPVLKALNCVLRLNDKMILIVLYFPDWIWYTFRS
jgi:hypothetical protein